MPIPKYLKIRQSLKIASIGASSEMDFLCSTLTALLDLIESEDYEEIVMADIHEYLGKVEEEI